MTNTGLDDLLKAAFGGVDKMLSGKNFPQNFRALRIVVEELLRDFILNHSNMEEMQSFLTTISSQSRTSKLWVNNLIRPVLYMMLYVRAEREGDWLLHIYSVTRMVPYFFAAGHPNYARYGLYYLNDMKSLPISIFIKVLERGTRDKASAGLLKWYLV